MIKEYNDKLQKAFDFNDWNFEQKDSIWLKYDREVILLVAKVVYLLTFNEPNFRDKLVNLEDFKKAILKLILKIGITKDRKGEINYFMRKSIL